MLSVNVWRHGNDQGLPARQGLRAGPLSVVFEQGELRSIGLGDREVINRIYAAVRDRNWETAPRSSPACRWTRGKIRFESPSTWTAPSGRSASNGRGRLPGRRLARSSFP